MKTYQKLIIYGAIVAGSLGLFGCRNEGSKGDLLIGRNYVATANLDRDNLRDVAIGDGNGNIYVLWNKGDGSFDKQHVGDMILGKTPIATGDMNGNELEDIVATDGNGNLHIFYNNGDRSFRKDQF